MLMLRPRISVVAVAVVVMDMRHAVAVCRDLPMFEGMHALRDGQHNEADQPERSQILPFEHQKDATCASLPVKPREMLGGRTGAQRTSSSRRASSCDSSTLTTATV